MNLNFNQQISGNSFNDIFLKAFYQIKTFGSWTTPREFKCKEIICPQLILHNPLKSLITIRKRKLNYAYLIVEKMMYLTGTSYPEILLKYNSNMKNYLNPETNDFDGAYGPRIIRQLDYCYNILKKDNDSRQAVITIHNDTDCRVTKDNACTLSIQFLIRDDKLHAVTNMRSNDLLWGLCLDVPAFSFIQQVMAFWLKKEVGTYIHQPASLHYYDNFEENLDEIYRDKINDNIEFNDKSIPSWNISYENTNHYLEKFWEQESNIRKRGTFYMTFADPMDHYLRELKHYWNNKKI